MCHNPFPDLEEDLDDALLNLWDKYVNYGKAASGEEDFQSSTEDFIRDMSDNLPRLLKERSDKNG